MPSRVTDGTGRWRLCRAGHARSSPSRRRLTRNATAPMSRSVVRDPEARPSGVDRPEADRARCGTDRVHPCRTVGGAVVPERATKHLPKLRRVAAEALQQSRGLWLPVVEGPVDAATVLPRSLVAEPGARPVGPGDRTIAIGPEGGWSADELANAAAAGVARARPCCASRPQRSPRQCWPFCTLRDIPCRQRTDSVTVCRRSATLCAAHDTGQ